MRKSVILITFVLIAAAMIVFLFMRKEGTSMSAETAMQVYCAGCHLKPDPANIPKSVWRDHVLPDMAARLGRSVTGYNPYDNVSLDEMIYLKKSKAYPEEVLIDTAMWNTLSSYIIGNAPDSINPYPYQVNDDSLTAFTPQLRALNRSFAGITSLKAHDDHLYIGSVLGKLKDWNFDDVTPITFRSPVMGHDHFNDQLYTIVVGNLNPSERALGTLFTVDGLKLDTLAQHLHRPVYIQAGDLDKDGSPEILVCEFGNHTGELSLIKTANGNYVKETLLNVPGTIKTEIADMNGDGMEDIIVLASQGDEGIFILYQTRDLKFNSKHVIRLPSIYGSSWFELFDYEGDGDLDIAIANGDNADLSKFLKPYHGIRLFLNDGNNNFEQKLFYPIHGATGVVAADFDKDGDFDLGVLAFFPDFNSHPERGFVYLENQSMEDFRFKAYTTSDASASRWLVMEKADIDQDGDLDIILGGMTLPPENVYRNIIEQWEANPYDLLILENNLIKNPDHADQ